MDIINIEGGHVVATDQPLTVRGLLLPYNEVGRTNVGLLMVEAGTVAVPTDPSVISHNLDHVRQDVVARAILLEDLPDDPEPGVYATYRYADTKEGREAYADATSPTGKRRKLSAEFGPVKVKEGKLVAGIAKLWGSAQVERGAYPSAMVLAADTPDTVEVHVDPDPNHAEIAVDVLPADITATTPAGDSAVYTPDAAPVANPESESNVTATAIPATLPGAPQVLATETETLVITDRPVDKSQVFAAIAAYKANPNDHDAEQVLAALQNVTLTGANALPATGVVRPNWVGQINKGAYVREYIDLGNHGTDISAAGKSGFKVKRGTVAAPIAGPAGIPNGGTWAGDKVDINSYQGRTEVASSSLRRFAVGDDIGREFYDLPAGAEVVESFLSLLVEDYDYWSDSWALIDLISAPAAAPVAAIAYPATYPASIGMLIQGILAVKARKGDGRRDVPTFAVANDLAYAELCYAAGGDQNLPAFVNLAVTTASHGTVDGNVTIAQGDNGIVNTKSVTVGAGASIDFDELAGGPLSINALEVAKGGIDRAVHGYLQTYLKRPEAFVTIGTADVRANTTAYGTGRIISAAAVVYRVIGGTAGPFGGTTGAAAPAAPAVGATVVDGTATLLRLV